MDTDAFIAEIMHSQRTSVAVQAVDRQVLIVCHGELYGNLGGTHAEYCLAAYLKGDLGFLTSLNGSYALVIVDARKDRILFVTDPVNSRKLFLGVSGDIVWVSTMHAFGLHPCTGMPDPVGVAHCLVNGVPLNGRTPFEGVRTLERASIHELQGTDVRPQTYWRYEPQPDERATAASLKGHLRDALLAAVQRRLPSVGELWLSLSGGYDSTSVLGAFGHLQVPDVRCFTYRRPGDGDDSDAAVACRMAEVAGYQHTEIDAFRDNVVSVMEDNVRLGRGMTRLVIETDSWRTVSGLLAGSGEATVWVADVCMGISPARTVLNDTDVLRSLEFGDWNSLGRLESLFATPERPQLREALGDDLASMLDRNRVLEDPCLLRDYLYLDQRLPRLLSWREAFAEPCGPVLNPLIDKEVLELRQVIPQHLSMGKGLFKETVREAFPSLFAIDRARAGTWLAGQWCRDRVRSEPAEIATVIRAMSSPLDRFLPPENLLRLIEQEAGLAGKRRSLARQARAVKGRVRKRIRTSARRDAPPLRPCPVTVDPAVFVLRAITLRQLFRQREHQAGG